MKKIIPSKEQSKKIVKQMRPKKFSEIACPKKCISIIRWSVLILTKRG